MQGFTTMVRRIWSALLKAKAGFVWYVREFSEKRNTTTIWSISQANIPAKPR